MSIEQQIATLEQLNETDALIRLAELDYAVGSPAVAILTGQNVEDDR